MAPLDILDNKTIGREKLNPKSYDCVVKLPSETSLWVIEIQWQMVADMFKKQSQLTITCVQEFSLLFIFYE